MAPVNSDSMVNLQSLFKKAYADKILDSVPDHVYLARKVPAVPYQSTPGGTYEIPVVLNRSTGMTKAPGDVDIFSLNLPIGMTMKSGQLVGSQALSRMAFSYEALSRSENSSNKFESLTKVVVASHLADAWFYMESDMLYGKSATGIGVVSSTGASDVVITLASFAPGIWIGNEAKEILIEDATNTVLRGTAAITGIDIETRTITLDVLPAGTVATDVIRWKCDGLAGVNSFKGLISIANQTTGTLFNIPAATYSLWKPIGVQSNSGLALTFQKILQQLNKAVNRGLGSIIKEVDLLVSIATFSALSNDENAKRRYDYSYKTDSESGIETLQYYSQAGVLNVRPHHMMKEGECLFIPKPEKAFQRIGSQANPTFNLPGQGKVQGQDVFLTPIPNSSGVEARLYYNTSLFPFYPHQILHVNGIVNPVIA